MEYNGADQLVQVMIMERNVAELCRLCTNSHDQMIPIFQREGSENELSSKISKYLPIEVTKSDELPLQVCYICAKSLISWHKLYERCKLSDRRLRNLLFDDECPIYEDNFQHNDCKDILTIESMKLSLSQAMADNVIQSVNTNTNTTINGAAIANVNSVDTNNERLLEYWHEKLNQRPLSNNEEDEHTPNRCVCAHCNEVFPSMRAITTHLTELRLNTSVPESEFIKHEFECHECSILFANDFEMHKHMVLLHGVKDKECEFEDWKIKLEGREHKCVSCGKAFNHKRNLVRHERLHTHPNDRPPCSICGKKCTDLSSLKQHQMYVHKVPHDKLYLRKVNEFENYIHLVSGKKMYKCDYCTYSTHSMQRFQRHHTRHTNPAERNFICNDCGKQFRLRDTIINHLKYCSHNRDEGFPFYKCDSCPKTFVSESNLKFHQRVHATDELGKSTYKAFKCNLCQKTFSSSCTLSAHHRLHTGEKPYVCETCGKNFAQSSALYVHKFIHTNERRFICELCNKSFNYKQSFETHMRGHNGERNFTCDQCGKSFFDPGVLARHRFVHVTETPFICCVCGASFKMKRYLHQHEATHYKVKKSEKVIPVKKNTSED